MAGRIEAVLVMLAIPVLIVLGLTIASDRVLRRTGSVPMDVRFPGLRGAWGVTERSRVLAVVLGVVIVVAGLVGADRYGLLAVVLAPATAALAAVVVVLAGQRVVGRRVAGAQAGLEVRRIGDYLPRGLAALGALLALLLAVAIGAGLAWSGPGGDSFEYAGTVVVDGRAEPCGGSMSPFFGSAYAIPLAALVVVLLAAAAIALRAIAARPRNGAEPAIVVADDEVRRRAAMTVTAATVGGIAGSLACALWLHHGTATSLRLNTGVEGSCAPAVLGWQQSALGWACVAAVLVGLWCLARMLRPGARRPVDAGADVGGGAGTEARG